MHITKGKQDKKRTLVTDYVSSIEGPRVSYCPKSVSPFPSIIEKRRDNETKFIHKCVTSVTSETITRISS